MQTYYIPHLAHHGIEGQKWGVHNGPPYPIKAQKENPFRKQALTNIKGARMSNVDKWGQDASHNCLYIFGLSGSGKSTTALGLAKNSDPVIHLDCYIEPDSDDRYKSSQDESFNRYLDKNVPKWKELAKSVQRDGSSKNRTLFKRILGYCGQLQRRYRILFYPGISQGQ